MSPLPSELPCGTCGTPKLDGLCPHCDLTPVPMAVAEIDGHPVRLPIQRQLPPSQLAPGVYAVGEEIHFELGEMLKGIGVPDTPENRDRAVEGIRLACSQVLPGTPVREV